MRRLAEEKVYQIHRPNQCVKSLRIRSYSGPHFTAFGLNTERYYVSPETPNTDTFYAVDVLQLL